MIPIERVHPDNSKLAIAAAKALKLDICGVDMIITDIRKSWRQHGGKIIELNAQPQIGAALAPETYSIILRDLVSDQSPYSILLVLSKGEWNATPTHPVIVKLLQKYAGPVAIATSSTLWEENEIILETAERGGRMINAAMQISSARTILFILTQDEVLRCGLPNHTLNKAYLALPGDSIEFEHEFLASMSPMIEGIEIEILRWHHDK